MNERNEWQYWQTDILAVINNEQWITATVYFLSHRFVLIQVLIKTLDYMEINAAYLKSKVTSN